MDYADVSRVETVELQDALFLLYGWTWFATQVVLVRGHDYFSGLV